MRGAPGMAAAGRGFHHRAYSGAESHVPRSSGGYGSRPYVPKEGAMARRSMRNPMYEVPFRITDNGAVTDLKSLYVYPDGHANLTFADGKNWPCADGIEVVEAITYIFREMQREAKKAHPPAQ